MCDIGKGPNKYENKTNCNDDSTLPGCIGVKTGYTIESNRCLVSATERNGMTLAALMLNDKDDWNDRTQLTEYGFRFYERVCILDSGEYNKLLPVVDGDETTTIAVTKRGPIVLLLPKNRANSHPFKRVFGFSILRFPRTRWREP